MENVPHKLKEELDKSRSQLYLFYELTKAMRTTLRLDEIVYIILTCLTAHQGLGFNRAMLFLVDNENKNINGFMGIGPIDAQEATQVWESIENDNMDLYSLIKAYKRMKEGKRPRFMEFIQSLSFPFSPESGFIYENIFEKGVLHIYESKSGQFKNDPLIRHLKLKDFLIFPLWIKNNPRGIIVVDNCITKQSITDDDKKIFTMFVEQAQGAIENSQIFEAALMRAHTDSLTGLWNHGYFQYRLDEELAKAKSGNYPLSIMMADLDDFKKFNDAYGHITGDKALKGVSLIFRHTCRKADILCRYGGEEFSIILPYTQPEESYLLAERIRKSVENSKISNKTFTISIGIASLSQHSQTKEELVKSADLELYRAKKEGKNQVMPLSTILPVSTQG